MQRPLESDPAQCLRGIRVLVFEDDPISAKLASIVLGDAGAEVKVAASVELASETIAQFRPQLIVLDRVLRGHDGLALAKQLKADPATQQLVLVMVSAHNGPTAARAANEAGCAAYITKPIDTDTFAAELAEHLGETP